MMADYSKYYAKFHPDDAGHRTGLRALHHRLLSPHLPADRSAPILDVGCGRGYAIEDVQALGYAYVSGIDPDRGQATYAQGRGLAVEHATRTEEFLEARGESYAAILLMDVLEHIPREAQPDFLRAVCRSLRPGGRLICTVPNAASAIAAYWLYNDYTHQHSFTADSLSFLLDEAGFCDIDIRGYEFVLRPRFLFWLPTARMLQWLLRAAMRLRRRAEFVGELGWGRGRNIVLSPNLLAIAGKSAR